MKDQPDSGILSPTTNQYIQKILSLFANNADRDLQSTNSAQQELPLIGTHVFAMHTPNSINNSNDFKGKYLLPSEAVIAAIEYIDSNNKEGATTEFSISERCSPIDMRYGNDNTERAVYHLGTDIVDSINNEVCDEDRDTRWLGSYITTLINSDISDDMAFGSDSVQPDAYNYYERLGRLALKFVSQNAKNTGNDGPIELSESSCEKLGALALDFVRKNALIATYGIKHECIFSHVSGKSTSEHPVDIAALYEAEFIARKDGWHQDEQGRIFNVIPGHDGIATVHRLTFADTWTDAANISKSHSIDNTDEEASNRM